MNKEDIINVTEKYLINSAGNYISEETALHPGCVGMRIYDAPIFSFGIVDDELYAEYKSHDVIGSHFLSPRQWLPTAKTVIAFFLPYTEKIKTANAPNNRWPADEWLHSRYEGQLLLGQLLMYLAETISEGGYKSIVPTADPRYKTGLDGNGFTSNWSERHVAYACGLGTFGLSKGIITKKGMSGRLGSIITELDLPKDTKEYSAIYEYCTMCGACIGRCPAGAISKGGKDSALCSGFLDKTREKHKPRYGCGKCQVRVPCESSIPKKIKG